MCNRSCSCSLSLSPKVRRLSRRSYELPHSQMAEQVFAIIALIAATTKMKVPPGSSPPWTLLVMNLSPTAVAACLLVLLSCGLAAKARADDEGITFFEQKIRPVLVQHCYSCHSVAARDEKKLQGALYLDSAAGVAAGGESGAVLVKGKPEESPLIKALKWDGMEMPPSGKLSDEIIADFAKWIELGAPDPREGESPEKQKREINIEEGKKWWAFQPLRGAASPEPRESIDGFIRQAQQSHGLKPAASASKERLIRRAYFDLVGLPPTPEQVAAFVADGSAQAFEKVVDELLASPAYGERWARHWLDAARFAESGGYEFDGFRPGAFHYRDWVIRALNDDLPFNEFVRQQLAGDKLYGPMITLPQRLPVAFSSRVLIRVKSRRRRSKANSLRSARRHADDRWWFDARPDAGLRSLPRSQVRSDCQQQRLLCPCRRRWAKTSHGTRHSSIPDPAATATSASACTQVTARRTARCSR